MNTRHEYLKHEMREILNDRHNEKMLEETPNVFKPSIKEFLIKIMKKKIADDWIVRYTLKYMEQGQIF